MIAHTLDAWAKAIGRESRTLERRLSKAGHTLPGRGGKIPARWVYDALVTTSDESKERLTIAQAEKVERENLEAEGVLVNQENVERELWDNGLGKCRESLLDWKKSTGIKIQAMMAAANCDPDLIKRVLDTGQAGVEEPLRKLSDKLSKR